MGWGFGEFTPINKKIPIHLSWKYVLVGGYLELVFCPSWTIIMNYLASCGAFSDRFFIIFPPSKMSIVRNKEN
jgi:hypothetical protein